MSDAIAIPPIIQGGMGVGISNWRLARAVSMRGQLGVVTGTGIDTLFVRRLQDGDAGGHIRRALQAFPIRGAAADSLRLFFRPEGRPPGTPYTTLPKYKRTVTLARERITMLAAFVEVYLAKERHAAPVGMNLLTKIQLPSLAALYGAMLAGVDAVLMGAGVPREIPGALDRLAAQERASLRFEVEGLRPDAAEFLHFDPRLHWDEQPPVLRRPRFFPIVASNSLATVLVRKASGRIDGIVIEGPTGGGHNAPARGAPRSNERGEPIYGERDDVDLKRIGDLGLPYWVAGGTGDPERVRALRDSGAAGVQVGTLFAYCDESGMEERLKRSVLEHAARGEVDVVTDRRASPTGYPFKLVRWIADPAAGVKRERICDIAGLRVAYAKPDGTIGYRCPAEPVDAYLSKGGRREDTEGRMCLCNGLMATAGVAQVRAGGTVEPPIVTSGEDLKSISGFLAGRTRYSASDVIDYLLPA